MPTFARMPLDVHERRSILPKPVRSCQQLHQATIGRYHCRLHGGRQRRLERGRYCHGLCGRLFRLRCRRAEPG